MAAAGGNAPLAPHMRYCAQRRHFEWMGNDPPSLRMYFLGGLRVFMALKALLAMMHRHKIGVFWGPCKPQQPQKLYLLARGLSPIHSTRWRGAKGLVWGSRGPFPPAAAMVGYGCDGCWRHTSDRPTVGIVEIVYGSIFFYSPIHSWHLTRQLNKKDLDLCTLFFRWFLCPVLYGSTATATTTDLATAATTHHLPKM